MMRRRRERPPPPLPNPHPKPSPPSPRNPKRRKSVSPYSPTSRMTARSPGQKSARNLSPLLLPPPPPRPRAKASKAVCAAKPATARSPTPRPPNPQRWWGYSSEEGQPPRRSRCRDGRLRYLPLRVREGRQKQYPWAEGWCYLGKIPSYHHPLRGGPAPPLPH